MDAFAGMSTFVAVVEGGSLSAAARQLGQTPSAVSKQIARLEDRLDVRLLTRTTRRLALTDEGRAYYDRCRQILADVDEAEQAIARTRETPRGLLRVSAPTVFGRVYVAPLLHRFLERYPEIELDMQLSERVVDIVEDNVDLAIRIAVLRESSRIARRIAPSRRVIAAAPSYWARAGLPRRPRDLSDHACLIQGLGGGAETWHLLGPDGRDHAVPVTGPIRCNNMELLLEAALDGAGVINAMSWVAGAALRDGRLVWPPGRHLSPKVRVFVDFLVAAFAPPPWDDRPAAGGSAA